MQTADLCNGTTFFTDTTAVCRCIPIPLRASIAAFMLQAPEMQKAAALLLQPLEVTQPAILGLF